MKQILLLMFLSFAAFSAMAQQPENPKCRTAEVMQDFFQNHPEQHSYWDEFNHIDTEEKSGECAEHYVIPVVFHVFHDNGSSFVTPAQIQSALDGANSDFNGKNGDFFTIDPAFDNLKGTMNITFVLPTLDPDGNPTSGINYYPTNSGLGNGSGYNDEIASYAWDNYKYLNVYVMNDLYNDGETTNSGVAWYPDSWMSDNGLSRIVYNYWYLGNSGSSIADPEFQSTFTHEIGHWLNLAHTFDQGCFGTGDWVDDTPTTDGSAGCGPNAFSCGHLTNGENYMDYNSSCYKMFTQGQIQRMTNALENHPARFPIWQRENLIATGTIQHYQYATPVADFSTSATEIAKGESVILTDLSCGFPESWEWTIDGGNPDYSTEQNPVITFNSSGVFDVHLIVSNEFGESEPYTTQIFVDASSSSCAEGNDFEADTPNELSNGWTSQSMDPAINWLVAGDVFINWDEVGMFNSTGYNSVQSLYCPENWGQDGPTEIILVSPEIDLTNMDDPQLSYYDLRGWDYLWPEEKLQHLVKVLVSTEGPEGPWEELEWDIATTDDFQVWREISGLSLSSYIGQTVHIGFQTDTHHYYWRIDNFCVSDGAPLSNQNILPDHDKIQAIVANNRLSVNAQSFELHSIMGHLVNTYKNQQSIDISLLPTGIYVVRAEVDGIIQSQKIFID